MISKDVSLSSLQERLDKLRQDFDAAASTLSTELADATGLLDELKAADEERTAALGKAEERVVAQDELIETLNQELLEAKSARGELRGRELEIERMRAELESKNDLVKAVREQVARATEQNTALHKQLSEATEQTEQATAIDNAEIVALKAELEARRATIKNLREEAARAESLEEQLNAKRESIAMLEESIDQHVQTIAELRKSADAWKFKYSAARGAAPRDSDTTLTEQPAFTDTEVDLLKKFDQSPGGSPEKTLAINMRSVLDRVRSQKFQKAQDKQKA